ncbi:YsnF/AvaK domain-containing protein [Deinococcus peraridilitoris]|uniref:DUF2382 domain-containing protein n=1 Tax=Deinococcus peraridilitoris (strain DSM 19664 / LMG 22246 / CIP 109416 / KR-200) TaxID=937777 RepID=L0A094_DEIPD|nr:YsnF/AvaK domain-containing protein [Deinococcus peraridilitoris]AFZ67261.1 hypothetical protein Deipe_1742 [Deinococcus peraridilitoris DSM 19664]
MNERREQGVQGQVGTEGTGLVEEVARFELLEERALVEKRREVAGRVQIRRMVERHTETLTVELLTETLVIEVAPGSSGVTIDGEALLEGQTREIVTYREEAVVTKRPVVSEEVRLFKRGVTNEERFNVELGREILRVHEVDLQTDAVIGRHEGDSTERDSAGRGRMSGERLTGDSGGDLR